MAKNISAMLFTATIPYKIEMASKIIFFFNIIIVIMVNTYAVIYATKNQPTLNKLLL
ncbi:protein of unknown function [Xenorhabdus bovienii]|uniref:Uncharacterized protein n=1 Tax=Xenorhabdus bovienii TaxID=40576 RepID=A0A0B6X9Z7_XENBV|nr:protein of unknown function [Xenorhabdus bovienii]